jgi:hypothetical protein
MELHPVKLRYAVALFSLCFLILSFSSCMKKESFSDVPEISPKGFELFYDTGHYPKTGIISFYYQDGDGDIGLSEGDTFPPFDTASPYYYNLVITYYEKQNGTFVPVDLSPPFSARIPVLTPNDPGKPIKGFIDETLILYPPPNDTIKFELFIYDRALHKSNTISTPPIVLRR